VILSLFACIYARRHVKPVPAAKYVALGGSNTVGALDLNGKIKGAQKAFSTLVFQTLQIGGNVTEFLNGGIGAMGPELAASCSARFVPPETRYATVEYLPNIGYTNDDVGELAALEKIVQSLRDVGAKTVMVNIVPGGKMERFANCVESSVGCTTRRHIEQLHEASLRLATRYGLPSISLDNDDAASSDKFGPDMMHLNQRGHDLVHDWLMTLYATHDWSRFLSVASATSASVAASVADQLPVRCYLGEQLGELIGPTTSGFQRVNFAREPTQRADKVGWEARNASASVTLCARFPRGASPPPPPPPPPLPPRRRRRIHLWPSQPPPSPPLPPPSPSPPPAHRKGAAYGYQMAVGLQMSHDLNPPLLGQARLGCSGACRCECLWSHHGAFNASCIFDGLGQGRITITAFARLLVSYQPPKTEPLSQVQGSTQGEEHTPRLCPDEHQCAVTISNSADASVRHRVLVRALIFGVNDHYSTRWFNTYHMDIARLTFARE